jgi:hypothetical protein
MTKLLLPILSAITLLAAASLPAGAADTASGFDALQGKWSLTKTEQDGQRITQVVEVKQGRLTFQILNAEGQVRALVKGRLKADKTGSFNVLTVSDLQVGRSADELQPVGETRALVYTMRGDTAFFAMNFDREQDNEKPSIDAYTRVAGPSAAAAGAGLDESKLLGAWKVEVVAGDNTNDYELRISKADGKLEATLISPRSGEHKYKSVICRGSELVMELERERDGETVTLIYKARMTGDGLSGTLVTKGQEDQSPATWKASK